MARLRDADDCTEGTTSCTSPTVNSSSDTTANTRSRTGSAIAFKVRTKSMVPNYSSITIYRYFDTQSTGAALAFQKVLRQSASTRQRNGRLGCRRAFQKQLAE